MSEQPTPSSSPPPLVDRRLSPRRPARPGSKVFCLQGGYGVGRNIALAVLDISETGVRLRLRELLQRGQEIRVGFLPPGFFREFRMSGVVVWCVPAHDGTHLAGVRLDEPLSFVALQAFCRLASL